MKYFFILFTFTISSFAQAAQVVNDANKLGTVSLHTEVLSSKRVYLAADFEASASSGLIGCDLKVEHKRGKASGVTNIINKSTTLLSGEKIPFNLGIFPVDFHASGLDVKASLICKKISYFNKSPLLKSSLSEEAQCCLLNEFMIVCARDTRDAALDLGDLIEVAPKADKQYPSCYP